MSTPDVTPLMRQYLDIKKNYSDALVLFQVGDFYELFFDDAKKAAHFLGITLTKRGKNNGEPIPLCGVPVHTVDHYLAKLIKGGYKVAIVDQLEEPKPGKVVERGVTQVLTPGTLTDGKWLSEKSASYLLSFFPGPDYWGLLFGELLTAQLYGTVIPSHALKSLEAELARFFPDEIIIPQTKESATFEPYFKQLGYYTSTLDAHELPDAQEWVSRQINSSKAGPTNAHTSLKKALYYFYDYINQTQAAALEQFNSLHVYQPEDFLILDAATQRNLELVRNAHDGSTSNTLFEVLDCAVTPMGSRMIKKWIMHPLVNKTALEQRYDVVSALSSQPHDRLLMQDVLQEIGDIERVVGRIALKRAQISDYRALLRALQMMPAVRSIAQKHINITLIAGLCQHIDEFLSLRKLLIDALHDDHATDWIIKKGFDSQLDAIRDLVESGNQKIVELELHEQQKTGISSLKIRYNQVHGYYIEITKSNMDLVPDYFVRQQTLVGRERYMTAQLQQLQHDIVRAKADIAVVEQAVFEQIKRAVYAQLSELRKCAYAIAYLDALLALSQLASDNGYVRPIIHESKDIIIEQGRHPTVEQGMNSRFIPNDTHLTDSQSTWIITGPNMGGKSTYLRQVALIAIMAQIGSFVPAKSAALPLLDRIFTRIGAGDNVAQGKSTFLVEMEETATICTQATERSLVILDEVGRGTSTFDGLAIAQAVVEYIHTTIKARCLFATHYHELTHLQEALPSVGSYYAASKKNDRGIIFLYKIIKGIADGSFGIEVAKLAHLPPAVVQRSYAILDVLAGASHTQLPVGSLSQLTAPVSPLCQSEPVHEAIIKRIQEVDCNQLTPKQAFELLWQFKETLSR
jgi:DNA mismatch repair protein MutS